MTSTTTTTCPSPHSSLGSESPASVFSEENESEVTSETTSSCVENADEFDLFMELFDFDDTHL